MADRLFEVVAQSPYSITINQIENIEDAGDSFITEEELQEMGLSYYSSGPQFLKSKITTALSALLAEIPKGRKSIIIPDDDLVEALKETSYSVSDFVPNTRRVGNRLFRHEKKDAVQNEVKYKNWTNLVMAYERILSKKFKVYVDLKRNDSDRANFVTMFKQSFTWEDVLKHGDILEENLKWCKVLWDEPTLVQEVKGKK